MAKKQDGFKHPEPEDIFVIARRKGFIPYFNKEWKHNSNEPLRRLFALTDMKAWLVFKHHIFVQTEIDLTFKPKWAVEIFQYFPETFDCEKIHQPNWGLHRTEPLALEEGLLVALNLIPDED